MPTILKKGFGSNGNDKIILADNSDTLGGFFIAS